MNRSENSVVEVVLRKIEERHHLYKLLEESYTKKRREYARLMIVFVGVFDLVFHVPGSNRKSLIWNSRCGSSTLSATNRCPARQASKAGWDECKLQEAGADIDTSFLLSEICYARAAVPPSNRICLWLGVGKHGGAFRRPHKCAALFRPTSWSSTLPLRRSSFSPQSWKLALPKSRSLTAALTPWKTT